jgi:hypothetical protein
MANSTVSIFIRFKSGGKRQTVGTAYAGKARLKPGTGKQNGKEFPCPTGVYWLRWYDGLKQVWKRVGVDPSDALKAQMRQEDILAGESVPVEAPKRVSRVTLDSAVEDFLAERSTQTDERGLKRWCWELELFQRICGKTYLHEVSRAHCFTYMKWYQDRKKKPRTVCNRMAGLGVLLKVAKHTA